MAPNIPGSRITGPTKRRLKRLIPALNPVYGIWLDYKTIHFVTSEHNHVIVNVRSFEWDFTGENVVHFGKCEELFNG